jgi:hypothetical protein
MNNTIVKQYFQGNLTILLFTSLSNQLEAHDAEKHLRRNTGASLTDLCTY